MTIILFCFYFSQAEESDSSNGKTGAVITSQPKILAKRYIFTSRHLIASPHNPRKPTPPGQLRSLYSVLYNTCITFCKATNYQSKFQTYNMFYNFQVFLFIILYDLFFSFLFQWHTCTLFCNFRTDIKVCLSRTVHIHVIISNMVFKCHFCK